MSSFKNHILNQSKVSLTIGIISTLVIIFDFGFEQSLLSELVIYFSYSFLLFLYLGLNIYKLKLSHSFKKSISSYILLTLNLILLSIVLYDYLYKYKSLEEILYTYQTFLRIIIILYLLVEFSILLEFIYKKKFQPGLIFASSFAFIIIFGAMLLMLPTAHNGKLYFFDSIFTATSAVTVTGLAVLDTGKDFTLIGQTIILILFQLGGIGVLTITSFFAYFFKENISYKESMYVQDFVSSGQLNNVFKFTLSIVIFTIGFEAIGAILIYLNIPVSVIPDQFDRLFFAVFHSVSAFCNAGFSTLTNSLYEETFRFNYNIHLACGLMIILGGLGYNIVYNLLHYSKLKLKYIVNKKILKKKKVKKPIHLVTLNSKIVINTTLLLILVGTIGFYALEYNNILLEHTSFYGKLVTSFFGGITPRTAGFNTIDNTSMLMPTLLFVIVLMWIGANPASTGGGIKTSTFVLAVINLISIVRGKSRITIGTRTISQYSISRSYSIILVSLILIFFGVFLISIFDPKVPLIAIIFECVSAYSTVGLSLGITASLSTASKTVIIFLMFVGRVGTINLLIGFLRKMQSDLIMYPEEEILIN